MVTRNQAILDADFCLDAQLEPLRPVILVIYGFALSVARLNSYDFS